MGSFLSKRSPFIDDPAVYSTRVGTTDGHQSKDAVETERTYDYVIVGGGTAASVLAHRLTEDPTISVLVIEAGKSNEHQLFSRLPATWPKTLKTEIDWAYTTTKQTNVENRSMYTPSGKVVGGSSTINAMMYQRPCADELEEWTDLGATGWNWESFKGYLFKAEKYTLNPDRPNSDASFRGNAGYWFTSHPDHYPIAEKFLQACEKVGIPRIGDVNKPSGPLGATYVSGFVDQKGQRSSAANAYLTPAVLARPNLTIAIEATVTKIRFSTSSGTPRAIGVELAKKSDGPRYRVAARREVLCCAGAYKTPQVLTVSGIGPSDELKRLGLPVVKELDAVGKNFYDHLIVAVAFRAKKGRTMDPLFTPTGSLFPLLRWLVTGGGPFAMLTGQAWAFVKSTNEKLPFMSKASQSPLAVDTTSGPESPDIEYIFAPVAFRSHGLLSAPPRTNVCTIGTVLLRPQSTGTITLKGGNIWDGANIDPNYLSVESDLDTFVRGVRLSLRMARSEPMVGELLLKADEQESEDLFFPGDGDPDKVTDEALKRWIRRTCETVYHPMGTARIGQSAANSVVDPELRVHGVSNLRVIDASVCPAPVAGHTCATVIGIAEKAADMLKATVY